MINLKVPAFFNDTYLDKINELNRISKNETRVKDTYGCIPFDNVGGTRVGSLISQTTSDYLKKYLDKSYQYGLGFNYIMNGTCHGDISHNEMYDKTYKIIRTLEGLGVNQITVSTPYLIQFVQKNFPKMHVTASINICISSISELNLMKSFGVKKIVIDRHINRNFRLLKKLVSYSDIEIEVLVNSMCLLFCSMHQFHNNINTHYSENSDKDFCFNYPYARCYKTYLSNPIEMLCSGWIRPENLVDYANIGVTNFKIEGRGEDQELVLNIIQAYLEQKYNGNLFDLLFTGYNVKKQVSAYILNQELDDFIQMFLEHDIDCRQCGGNNPKCKKVASKITFNEGNRQDMIQYCSDVEDALLKRKDFPEGNRYLIV
nr:U32 family peptidase [uncultured Blautia sp.]